MKISDLRQKFRKSCVEKHENNTIIQTGNRFKTISLEKAVIMKIRPIVRHKESLDQDIPPSGAGTVRLAAIVSRRGKKTPFSPSENCRPAPLGQQHA